MIKSKSTGFGKLAKSGFKSKSGFGFARLCRGGAISIYETNVALYDKPARTDHLPTFPYKSVLLRGSWRIHVNIRAMEFCNFTMEISLRSHGIWSGKFCGNPVPIFSLFAACKSEGWSRQLALHLMQPQSPWLGNIFNRNAIHYEWNRCICSKDWIEGNDYCLNCKQQWDYGINTGK